MKRDERDGRTSDTPLRLLLLTDTAVRWAGGSERFLRNLVSRLPGTRYAITLVQLCDEPEDADTLRNHSQASHINSLFVPVNAIYGRKAWRAYRVLRAMVEREQFDIVQSQHEKSDILNILLTQGSPRAARISNRRDTGFMRTWRVNALFHLLNPKYDRIIAPANVILDKLAAEDTVPRQKLLRIPNGVDSEHFQPADPERREALRAKIGGGKNEFLIGCVSRMTPVKRHVHLITAFADLVKRVPEARLILVGDGPLRARIVEQIKTSNVGAYVRLMGDVRDVSDILPALDACALVSETEGMSNAILEAMACGIPVVATDVGGNPELVEHERTGLLVALNDGAALTGALERFARDREFARACGAAARTRVLETFSLDRMAEAFDRLYQELGPRDHDAA